MNQWSEDVNAAVGIAVENHFDNFLFRIFYHFFACCIAVSCSGTCVEQTQIIVNLSGSTHGRAWIFIGGFLFDADNGAQSRNFIDIRTLHVAQKIACVGGECFHIAPLPFGKNGVERQR